MKHPKEVLQGRQLLPLHPTLGLVLLPAAAALATAHRAPSARILIGFVGLIGFTGFFGVKRVYFFLSLEGL